MVKADPTRNYYADLEISSNADTEEIKKQFRKLAMKHHPDRNPGREMDCIPKFQAIQAAHEVLTDPEQRYKYDAERRKRGYGSPAYGRPFASQRTTSNNAPFPPPPQRTRPSARPTATDSRYTSSGADRFSQFPRPPPPPPDEDPMNKFTAWGRMHSKAKPQQSQQRPPPPRPNAHRTSYAGGYPYAGAHSDQEDIHRTKPTANTSNAYASDSSAKGKPGVSRSNTTRSPKRPGFNPAAPGEGDEPPSRGASAYFTTSRFAQAPPEVPRDETPPQRGPAPTARKPDPSAYPEFDRRKPMPYGSTGGERTSLYSDNLRRSMSQRNPQKPGDSTGTSPASSHPSHEPRSGRHRSMSPPSRMYSPADQPNIGGSRTAPRPTNRGGNASRPFNLDYSDSDEEEDSPPSRRAGANGPKVPHDIKARPKAQPSPSWANGRASKNDQRQENVFQAAADQKRSQQQDGTSQQQRHSTMYGRNFSSSSIPRFKWSRDWVDKSRRRSDGKKRLPDWAYPATVKPPTPGIPIDTEEDTSQAPALKDPLATTAGLLPRKEPIQHGLQPGKHLRPSLFSTAEKTDSANETPNISFTMPLNHGPSAGPHRPDMKSKSEESISMKFSPNEWNGVFNGSSGYFAGESPASRNGPRARVSPVRGRAQGGATVSTPTSANASTNNVNSPQQTSNDFGTQATSAGGSSNGKITVKLRYKFGVQLVDSRSTAPPPPPPPQGFDASEWAEKLKESSFLYNPSDKPPSPVKRPTSKGRATSRSAPKPTTMPKPATVTEDVDESDLPGDSPTSEDSNRMDIDTDIPAATTAGAKPTTENGPKKGPRNVSAPTGRPEWRDAAKKASQSSRGAQQPEPRGSTGAAPAVPSGAGDQREASGGQFTGLNDLSNVAPFAPSREGLKDMRDLDSTLPFESRAGTATTNGVSAGATEDDDDLTEERQKLPSPPKAPSPPSRLSQQNWQQYLARFQLYATKWHEFNAKIVTHFAARVTDDDKLFGAAAGNSRGACLAAVGETTSGVGFSAVMRNMRRDEMVRVHWNVASEMHAEALKKFGQVRERMRKGGLPAV
ncbi:hypothetical protein BDY21DRAFT_370872 [Lineolata rhizophorae]|uniref:J domain-containing protein n=1 Tax=Lineolata rhizophorae TaxID=578093 RepID=A0A6A6P3W7_9PEZI|nr:hypothetical protein BDY21DRAFT_370872 [Lineolata rhizophorae]